MLQQREGRSELCKENIRPQGVCLRTIRYTDSTNNLSRNIFLHTGQAMLVESSLMIHLIRTRSTISTVFDQRERTGDRIYARTRSP